MKKIMTLVVFLAVVSGLSGLSLSLINDMTSPIIEEQKLAAVKQNLEVLYPGADFTEITENVEKGSAITNVYQASGSGEGYIYKVAVNGYGGEVSFLVAMNGDASYQGFVALAYDGETSGFGTRIADEEFSSQFSGKTVDDNIDTLAGATVTSSAVVKGIGQAVDHFNANYK